MKRGSRRACGHPIKLLAIPGLLLAGQAAAAPPSTTLLFPPPAMSNSSSATFQFTSYDGGINFYCRVDSTPPATTARRRR